MKDSIVKKINNERFSLKIYSMTNETTKDPVLKYL